MKGILTPLVTPLDPSGDLDKPGLERLVEHVIAGGVHGIFLLGTTGEGPNLSARLRSQVMEIAARAIGGRIPFVAGVTGASFDDSVDLACAAASAGAAAAVYAGPLYAPIGQPALAAHVARFADRSPLPVFLYNMPSHTHLFFSVETVAELAKHPRVAGLKDSSGDLLYFQRLRRAVRPEFPLLVGPEEMLLPALLAGADGGVNGGSNLFPRLFSGLYESFRTGDLAEARRLQGVILDLSDAVYTQGYLAGLKTALRHRGICEAGMAEPLQPLSSDAGQSIRSALDSREWR
jgi:4-hydroxy-tetrahydrodipicolinate synthase